MMNYRPPGASPAILTESQLALLRETFLSMASSSTQTIPLEKLISSYNAVEHPSVKRGELAPSAVRETLLYQFGECQKDHNSCVTYDEFVKYHEKVAFEVLQMQMGSVDGYLEDLITHVWRRGFLLAPTQLRQAAPIDEFPRGLLKKTMMTLVWPAVDENGSPFLYGIKDMVQPTFRRGDLPAPLQGFFAFPSELMGFRMVYLPPRISIKLWLDFVWEYKDGKYAAIEGIISARVPSESLPEDLQVLIMEHSEALKLPSCTFLETSNARNPMYKKTSENYGYRVEEECKKIANWKWGSLAGKVYGLQYHGTTGRFFSKTGPTASNAATGMNL